MPFVTGFLRARRRRPGEKPVDPGYGIEGPTRPGHELPGGEGPVDPDYGIDEGGGESIWPGLPDIGLPEPPPGIWPPLTPEHPWRPIPGRPPHVGGGPARPQPGPGQPLPGEPPEVQPPIVLPPGSIWPPLPPGVTGHYLALVLIAGMPGGPKYRYVVVDAGARPDQGLPGGAGGAQPK